MIIILEGLDRCGKSTQIEKLQPLLTDKPLHQLHYTSIKGLDKPEDVKDYSFEMYRQMFSFTRMYHTRAHFLLDRAHLGESVYSPIYRNYSGDYIFDIEEGFKNHDSAYWNDIYLITFVDSVNNLLSRDDGESHSTDRNKKKMEVDRFIRAHELSKIDNKLLINIEDKNIETVFTEIKEFLNL